MLRLTCVQLLLLTSVSQLSATLDGFRLVLIGDLHEMPMLNLETKPFSVSVSDWSAKVRGKMQLYYPLFMCNHHSCMRAQRSPRRSHFGI